MGDQFALAVLAAVATITATLIGSLAQRDSRRAALQEAELLEKLDPKSPAARDLEKVISRRIGSWTDSFWVTMVLIAIGTMWFGWALYVWGVAGDPRKAAPYIGVVIMTAGGIVLAVATSNPARYLFSSWRLQWLAWRLKRIVAKNGVELPPEVRNPPAPSLLKRPETAPATPPVPALPAESEGRRSRLLVPAAAAAAVTTGLAAIVAWRVRRRRS